MPYLFINYILPSAISLIALYGIFFFFLKNETFFRWNRGFLLVAILFSWALPFIKIPVYRSVEVANTSLVTTTGDFAKNVITESLPIVKVSSDETTGIPLLYYLYMAGTLIFLARVGVGLGRIFYIRFKNGISHYNGQKVIWMHNRLSHFSFFEYIFLNASMLNSEEETMQVLLHEKEHQRQWHCIDLILLELLILFQWFNPVVWFYNHSLKSIHEYQADQAVIRSGYSRTDYLNLIFKQVSGMQMLVSTNQFNYLSIKKRVIMISKQKSSAWAKNKILLFAPITVALLVIFSVKPVYSIVTLPDSKQEVLPQERNEAKTLLANEETKVAINHTEPSGTANKNTDGKHTKTTATPAKPVVVSEQPQEQGPVITFEKIIYDYGTVVKGADGNCVFKFKNTGNEPLILMSASPSCGCTVPTCPTEPIMPGKEGSISVRYNSMYVVGGFSKNITVRSNSATNGTMILTIKGNVVESVQ